MEKKQQEAACANSACHSSSSVREHLEQLTAMQTRLESQVRIVAAGHSQLVDQIADITVTLREQDRLIGVNASRMDSIDSALRENTELTRDIRDALIAGKVIKRAAMWIGVTALVVAQWWGQITDALAKVIQR